jgi:hypothetical protein
MRQVVLLDYERYIRMMKQQQTAYIQVTPDGTPYLWNDLPEELQGKSIDELYTYIDWNVSLYDQMRYGEYLMIQGLLFRTLPTDR